MGLAWLRCGNVAAILELDEHLSKNFKVGGGWRAYAHLAAAGQQRGRGNTLTAPCSAIA